MSDRTIIRPGGRRPKKGGGDKPEDAAAPENVQESAPADDAEDKTQFSGRRSRQSAPSEEPETEDKTQFSGRRTRTAQPAGDADKTRFSGRRRRDETGDPVSTPPDEVPAEDKTQVSTRRTQPSAPPEDTTDGDDRTQVSTRRPPAREPEPEAPKPKPDLSAIDDALGFLNDDDDVPPPNPDSIEPAEGDGEKTQFRPAGRRPTPARRGAPPPREPEPGGDGEKTQFRPAGRRPSPRPATSQGSSPADGDKTEIKLPNRGAGRSERAAPDARRAPGERGEPEASRAPADNAAQSLLTSNEFVKQVDALGSDRGAMGLVSPLLIIVGRLQSVDAHPNLEEFRSYATQCISHYEAISFGFGGEGGSRLSKYCSYGLCCLVDEIVLSTPWGTNSSWGDETLLEAFHGEKDDGHRFFSMLEELEEEPQRNLAALELFYLYLELGFEGKYREEQKGGRNVHDLRNQLFATIESARGPLDQTLSEAWQGLPERNQLLEHVPFWVVLAVTAGIVIAVFIGFNIMLSRDSDTALRTLAELAAQEPEIEDPAMSLTELAATGGPLVAEPDLARNTVDIEALKLLLFLEIDEGIVEVLDAEDAYVLRLKHPDLFRSGSDQIQEEYASLVETIGGFLKDTNNRILVTGHTDDVPVRSLKYPSNWELSKARAESVKRILVDSSGVGARIRAQGLADTDNIVPNSNARNRAINRRVEVQVRK